MTPGSGAAAEDRPAATAARFRRMVCSTVLVSEALVIGFAVLVAKDLSDVSTPVLLVVGGGGALLCLLLAGMLRRPWAYAVGTLLQLLLLVTGLVVPVMWGLGALFGLIWVGTLLLSRRVERIQRAHEAT
jgi:hypothetical protein